MRMARFVTCFPVRHRTSALRRQTMAADCGLHVNCPSGLVGPTASIGTITRQRGAAIRFRVDVEDLDQDPATLLVEWTSDLVPSPLGYGQEIWVDDLYYGTHTIRATVVDAMGLEAYDEVEVTIDNHPPTVQIMSPLTGWDYLCW